MSLLFTDAPALRLAARAKGFSSPTAGHCPGRTQANMVFLPASHAADFRAFAAENAQALPILEELAPGRTEARLAPGSDVRFDCPGYVICEHGRTREAADLSEIWREDFVSFLVGCSFTFEQALLAAGLPVRHIETGVNVPMYRTNKMMTPVGPFGGPMVVSMRPVPAWRVSEAVLVTAAFPQVHGAPVAVGAPEALGIADLSRPDFGDPVDIRPGEVPVFWACGVSGLSALMTARLPVCATHAPGKMFVTDASENDYRRPVVAPSAPGPSPQATT